MSKIILDKMANYNGQQDKREKIASNSSGELPHKSNAVPASLSMNLNAAQRSVLMKEEGLYLNKVDAPSDYSRLNAKLEEALALANDQNASVEKLRNVVTEAYKELSDRQVSIKFDIDEQLDNKLVVKLIRKGSGEVVWQFPPEKTIALQKLVKHMPGSILNEIV